MSMNNNMFFLGLDLGQAADYTALALVERVCVPRQLADYHVRGLERLPLGTSYPDVVTHVKELLANPAIGGRASLVADATGCGRPVMDMLRGAGLRPWAVTLTAGTEVTRDNPKMEIHLPKRDMAATLQVLLQCGRLKMAQGLREAPTLVKELLNFRVKIDLRTANDTYEAWREGDHDDLVFAVGLACWLGELPPLQPLQPMSIYIRRA